MKKTLFRFAAGALASAMLVAGLSNPALADPAGDATADPPNKVARHKKRVTVVRTHEVRTHKAAGLVLYADPATGQLYTKPAKGRIRVHMPVAEVEHEVERKVEQKQVPINETLLRNQESARLANQALAQEIQQIQPAWREYVDKFFKKFKIGATFYADYSLYTHTGFGPQFLENINPPGPGNNIYNSFDITRTYINFLYTPTEDWTFRITPDMLRAAGGSILANRTGKTSGVGSNLNEQPELRVKYAYVDYNTLFHGNSSFKEDKVTFGQIPDPLVPWEEDLFGYRYVTLVPWNYLGFSSTYAGLSVHGPIKFNELQYVDYDIGAFNNAKFSQFEKTNTKQFEGRISVYPFGARSRFDGLGLTGFYDYQYNNDNPDDRALNGTTGTSSNNAHISRIVALLHYTAETWGVAGEFDAGHNAFTSGNFFSGSGPLDQFGNVALVTAPTAPATTFQPSFDSAVRAILDSGRADQLGYAFFGHVQIPNTPLTLIGLFQGLEPNTKIQKNPLDFQRFMAGVEWKFNKYVRVALDSQNLLFYRGQQTFTAPEGAKFAPKLFGAGAKDVPFAVPRDTHSIFFNLEFTY